MVTGLWSFSGPLRQPQSIGRAARFCPIIVTTYSTFLRKESSLLEMIYSLYIEGHLVLCQSLLCSGDCTGCSR